MSNSSSSVFIASTDMNVGFNALMGLDLIEFGPDGGRAQVHIDARADQLEGIKMDELRIGMSDNEVLAHYRQSHPYISVGQAKEVSRTWMKFPASWCSRREERTRGRRR